MFRAFASVIRFCVVGGGGVVALGCGKGPEAQQPTPSLSETRAAQTAYRRIVRRWFEEDESRRASLRPSLERFLVSYGDDPRADEARLLLAWITILNGELSTARRLVAEGRASASPAVRDFTELLAARLLLAEQQPERALGILSQIEGKLVDPSARLLCTELRLQAALAAHHFGEIVAGLTAYLAAAPADLGDRVRARAKTAIDALPAGVLETSLSELQAKASRGPLSAPDVWLRRVLRERLIRLAVEQKDARLARRLLDSDPGLVRRNELGPDLLQLAASAPQALDAQGVFVGLALEIGDPDAERRSASVARGLAAALSASLPGADSLPIVVKASDAEHVEATLTELARGGALALVAGVSDTSVERAALWAAKGTAPVLLLRDTPNLMISELSFVLGTSDMDQLDAIHKELTRLRISRWMRVGPGGYDCRMAPEKAGDTRFPIRAWKQEDMPAVAILGPRGCALELYAEAREQRFAPLLALGLEGAEVLGSIGGRRFALGGGAFPSAKPGVDVPADFYELLGQDAGTLVRRTWATLGGAGAKPGPQLRARFPRALSEISVPLETTDATGFGGRRRLPRRLSIREAPP